MTPEIIIGKPKESDEWGVWFLNGDLDDQLLAILLGYAEPLNP